MRDYTTQSGRKLYFFDELSPSAQDNAAQQVADDSWHDDWCNTVNDLLFNRGIDDAFDIDCDFFGRYDWLTVKGTIDIDQLADAYSYDDKRPRAIVNDIQLVVDATAGGNLARFKFNETERENVARTLVANKVDKYYACECIDYCEDLITSFVYDLFHAGRELLQSYWDADNPLHDDQLYYDNGCWYGQCDLAVHPNWLVYDKLAAIV